MFFSRIQKRSSAVGGALCIGLDPDIAKIIVAIGAPDIFAFNRLVVDATADYASCFKPQIAHYSALAQEKALEQTIDYIRQRYPQIPVILDAKRADIESTAVYYALEAFERYQADAVTVNPYLGFDAIAPFLAHAGKGVWALAKTSNPGSQFPQKWSVEGQPLYAVLAEQIERCAGLQAELGFVVGANEPDAVRMLRERLPHRWFLIPGIGAQGGCLHAVLEAGQQRLLINASRSILYPIPGTRDYFEAVRFNAKSLLQAIRSAPPP